MDVLVRENLVRDAAHPNAREDGRLDALIAARRTEDGYVRLNDDGSLFRGLLFGITLVSRARPGTGFNDRWAAAQEQVRAAVERDYEQFRWSIVNDECRCDDGTCRVCGLLEAHKEFEREAWSRHYQDYARAVVRELRAAARKGNEWVKLP